jgi:hypothetical protein
LKDNPRLPVERIMKRSVFLLRLLALPLLGGCGSGSLPAVTLDLGTATVLRLGQSGLINGETATVRLDNVLEDSRCPANADCVSAGRIRVQARVTTLKGQFTQEASLPPPDVSIEKPSGYNVELISVDPLPLTGQSIPGAEYRFTAKVTKSP